MIKKRINTDLFIKDLTFVDKTTHEAIDLSNANNIKLSVRRQGSTEWVDQQFTQTDNKISFQWNSTENTRIGTFDALLSFDKTSSVSETGTIEYKYDAISLFQIVLTSNEEDGVDDMQTVQVVYYGGADGLSSYELAVKQGYTGTLEEFSNIIPNAVLAEQTRENNEKDRIEAETLRKQEFEAIKQEFESMKPNLVYYK